MEDEPPPPYQEVDQQQDEAQQPSVATIPWPKTRLMPLAFNIYSESATSGAVYFMGPHQKDRQFALTLDRFSRICKPKPAYIIYDGLTVKAPPIATSTNTSAEFLSWEKFNIAIYLNGMPRVEEPLVAIDVGTRWVPNIVYRYAIEVPTGSGRRQEFEWRENRIPNGLLTRFADDWSLVPLGNETETLAICAMHKGSLTKFLRFAFQGRGKEADYDPVWQIMAIMTGITVWKIRCEIMSRMG